MNVFIFLHNIFICYVFKKKLGLGPGSPPGPSASISISSFLSISGNPSFPCYPDKHHCSWENKVFKSSLGSGEGHFLTFVPQMPGEEGLSQNAYLPGMTCAWASAVCTHPAEDPGSLTIASQWTGERRRWCLQAMPLVSPALWHHFLLLPFPREMVPGAVHSSELESFLFGWRGSH